MNTEDKVQRFVVNPDKCASSKARKFYRYLTGHDAPRRIVNKDLQKIINQFNAAQIEAARQQMRGNKRATKYQRAICTELGHGQPGALTRHGAEKFLKAEKANRPDDFREAKEKLRGFTYKEEV